MKYFTQEEITWAYSSLQRQGLITQEEARKTMDRIHAKIPYKPFSIMPSIAMSETNIHPFKNSFRATQHDKLPAKEHTKHAENERSAQNKAQEKEALNSYENFTQSPQILESCLPNTNPARNSYENSQNRESKNGQELPQQNPQELKKETFAMPQYDNIKEAQEVKLKETQSAKDSNPAQNTESKGAQDSKMIERIDFKRAFRIQVFKFKREKAEAD